MDLRTCTSLELIQDIADLVKNPDASKHLNELKESYTHPLPLFRTVEECKTYMMKRNLPILSYDLLSTTLQEVRALVDFNCHHGQKKLAFMVIEFLTKVFQELKVPEEEVVVVYAGASSLATTIASTLFPKVRFVLYDPAPNLEQFLPKHVRSTIHREKHDVPDTSSSPIILYTGSAGWFDDEEAIKFAKKKDTILFISDIRVDNKEENIANDMLLQMKWAILTGSRAYMFKFRIPYVWDDPRILNAYDLVQHLPNTVSRLQETIPSAKLLNLPTETIMTRNQLWYLDGSLFLQIYPQTSSAELRLLGFAPKHTYRIVKYVPLDIEDLMATFNTFYRSHAKFATRPLLTDYIEKTQQFPSYEVVSELTILYDAVSLQKKQFMESFHRINKLIRNLIPQKTYMDQCVLFTTKSRATKYQPSIQSMINKHKALCSEKLKKRQSKSAMLLGNSST